MFTVDFWIDRNGNHRAKLTYSEPSEEPYQVPEQFTIVSASLGSYTEAFEDVYTRWYSKQKYGNRFPSPRRYDGRTMKHPEKFTDYPIGKIDVESFMNDAGMINNLRIGPSNHVSVIYTEGGKIRSNHYHKTDSHLLYVVSGKVLYFERPVGSIANPLPKIYHPGDLWYTPPMVVHATYFPERTILVSISERPRDHESHEEDLVRVEFITQDFIEYLWSTTRGFETIK